jgi:hypothetical protein
MSYELQDLVPKDSVSTFAAPAAPAASLARVWTLPSIPPESSPPQNGALWGRRYRRGGHRIGSGDCSPCGAACLHAPEAELCLHITAFCEVSCATSCAHFLFMESVAELNAQQPL